MMNINDNNYELWLLRYAEQELTADERAEVEQWLETHPAAAEELALYNEAPRLERDETVRYDAGKPRHTLPLWKTAWRWAAAAAVVVALMLPGLRSTSPAPRLTAGNTLTPKHQETPVQPEQPREKAALIAEAVTTLPPSQKKQPETLVALEELNSIEQIDSIEQIEVPEIIEQPALQYVDNLIVYEDEPEAPAEYAAAGEVVYTRTESGVNPFGLFISTFIKVNK